jgi:hypothetical protein
MGKKALTLAAFHPSTKLSLNSQLHSAWDSHSRVRFDGNKNAVAISRWHQRELTSIELA